MERDVLARGGDDRMVGVAMSPWLELRATILATLTAPRAVLTLFAIGVPVALGLWAISEAVGSWL
jgi:hypothetical protein